MEWLAACAVYLGFVFAITGSLPQVPEARFEWAAHIPDGEKTAEEVAKRHGLSLRGSVGLGRGQTELYRFFSDDDVDDFGAENIYKKLKKDPKVYWVSQQNTLQRERKSVLPIFPHADFDEDVLAGEEEAKTRVKRHHTDVNCVCKNITEYGHETFGAHVYEVMNRKSDPSLVDMFNDPKWPCQWELYNCGQTSGPHRVDLNVVPCWEKGFTGKGVVVTIVDDGLDYINQDLNQAFDPKASTDLNDNRDADGPMPNKATLGNDHGTKCGGEVAMRPNNNYCGVGVAYDATLGGIRFLDGVVTDTSEAAALVFNADYIDIYSCSWGPQDNGQTWEGPGRLASAALEVGSNEGRGGLGSIYVWAAGNGGASDDHCGADGYTCSIYTIGIASVSDQGLSTFYTESCSCIMAVTLNGGPHHLPETIAKYKPSHYLVTTDPYQGCVNTFTGTSSAAPLASGVLALVLQANPRLTWRDVQHLIARNSKIPNPTEEGWNINGAGLHVHHKYGFGLMDAAKLVMAAQSWKNVPKQQRCEVKFPNAVRYVRSGGALTFKGHTNACQQSQNRVHKLEHVQVIMSYKPKCRGDITVDLISPCGTRSQLMSTRSLDDSHDPVVEWPFMTVHSWGEDPRGVWSVEIRDEKGTATKCERANDEESGALVSEIRLVFWGTAGYKWKKIGCEGRQRAAEEVTEDTHGSTNTGVGGGPLNMDPKNPLNLNERLDQEIIEAEFYGEQNSDVTAEDLERAKPSTIKKSMQDTGMPSKDAPSSRYSYETQDQKDLQELRKKLIDFLSHESDEKSGEFLRNGISLERTERRRVN